MLETSAYLIVFVVAFGITAGTIPLMERLGRRWGIVSRAGGRRLNDADYRQVSKLGGVAMFLGFVIAVLIAQTLNIPRYDPQEVTRLTGLLIGATFIMLVGIIDDVVELRPLQLGLAQVIAATVAVIFQIFIEYFNNPFTGQQTDPWPFAVTVIVTMFWLGLMMNTVNFMDGLDGLAGGVAFIAGAMLFVNSAFVLSPAQTSVSLLPLALMGASLGFVMYNFYPSQIMMGGGAYFLGYVLGALAIIGGAKMATILLVMGLPVMDLVWQAAARIMHGRNPMQGDRGHIHFRLQDIGFSQRVIVLTYYAFCAFFGVLTLVLTSQLFKFIAFGVMVLLIIAAFLWLLRVERQAGFSKSS